jgi:hypothetical protein
MWITWFQEMTTAAPPEASSWTKANVIGTLGDVFALGALVVTIIYGEIQRPLAKRQFRIAQEEAEMRPVLDIVEMGLINLHEATTVPHNSPADVTARLAAYWGPESPTLPTKC